MLEITDDHYTLLRHFQENGGTLRYEQICAEPPTGVYWDKHEVGRLLRELWQAQLLQRGELTRHSITQRGMDVLKQRDISTKITHFLPDVYYVLSGFKVSDWFSWEHVASSVGLPEEISDTLKAKLFMDGYIKKFAAQIEEEEWLQVTDRFKLFYAGLRRDNDNNPQVTQNFNFAGRDMIASGNVNSLVSHSSENNDQSSKKGKTWFDKKINLWAAILTVITGLILIYEFVVKNLLK